MSSDQNWDVRSLTLIKGTLTGPYTLKKTGAVSPALVISNANNNMAGILIDSGNVNAYMGGNALGGSGSTITMGSPAQGLVAKLSINPLLTQPETTWAVGPVIVNGYGEVSFISDGTKTNIVNFGALGRSNRGVIGLRQTAGNMDVRQKITFSNGNQICVNGMLPPWVVTPASGDFLVYDGLVKNATYKTATNTWTSSDIVQNSTAQSLAGSVAVQALKVTAPLTVPAGMVLTNVTGGLILSSATLDGSGTIDSGTNDLIVYQTGTPWINPTISAPGLTVWGTGTLTVTNVTWSGDTFVHQGSLKTVLTQATVLANRNINGVGEFIKDGPNTLTLVNSTGTVGKITVNNRGALSILNSSYQVMTSLGFGNSDSGLIVSNGYVGTMAKMETGTGKTNIAMSVVGSGLANQPTILDCGNYGLYVGVDNGINNTMLVDGKGITGGAKITGISNSGNVGFAVGRGVNSSSNQVIVANGGEIWDSEADSNRSNGIGIGAGANGNKLMILGGNGFVSTLRKSYSNSIGSGAATGNVVTVDGAGVPGSAVFNGGGGLTIGGNGAYRNQLTITNGGIYRYSSVVLSGISNRLDVVGSGSQMYGDGSNHALYLGFGYATGNVMRVAEGGLVKDFTVWEHYIGGGHDQSGSSVGNQMIIGSGGTVITPKEVRIGQAYASGSLAMSNSVQITGTGALWTVANVWVVVGKETGGGRAIGNELRVENGGMLKWMPEFANHALLVGNMSDVTAGGESSGNQLTVANGGQVLFAVQVQVGSAPSVSVGIASNNSVRVTTGGVLEADKLVIGADANNTIAATDGGVYQFSTTTPTITSLRAGDIAISNGVISYTVLNSVFGNLSSALTNMTWRGVNAYRLTGTTTTSGSSQKYVFDPGFGSTNYFRLEMVSGNTTYQGIAGDSLTIGQSAGSGGEMLCSNTTARVTMPFIVNGKLRLVNSTLTITTNATVNGEVFIDLANASGSGPFLVAQKDLILGDSSTLRLSGAPVNGQVLMTYSGTRTGKFKVEGLPKDYTIKYDLGEAGTISILHTPTVITIR